MIWSRNITKVLFTICNMIKSLHVKSAYRYLSNLIFWMDQVVDHLYDARAYLGLKNISKVEWKAHAEDGWQVIGPAGEVFPWKKEFSVYFDDIGRHILQLRVDGVEVSLCMYVLLWLQTFKLDWLLTSVFHYCCTETLCAQINASQMKPWNKWQLSQHKPIWY